MVLRRASVTHTCQIALFATIAVCAHVLACPTELRQYASLGMAAIRAPVLEAHVKFLADDALEGRGTGTRGHAIAARYVAAEFEKIGLQPAGNDGTFFQDVPLRAMTIDDAGSAVELDRDGTSITLAPEREVLFLPFAPAAEVAVRGPLVFGGFGISAPERGYDDLAGIDLAGAIVVLFYGAPARFENAAERATLGDSRKKVAYLKKRGAATVLFVQGVEMETDFPWQALFAELHTERMEWLEGNVPASGDGLPVAWLSRAGFERMLAYAGFSGGEDALWTEAAAGKARARQLPINASLRVRSHFRTTSSSNVAAILRGADAKRAAEYVVVTAHLDHLGIGTAVGGDTIYNGAYDDACGVAALLELAHAFRSLPKPPPRSILFLATTGEEKKLLGSDYFAHHPIVPLASLVANINIDAPNPLYELHDVVALGAEHSSLWENARWAAATLGVPLIPDPAPEEAYFIRSDQYSFVKQGIPSMYPGAGFADAHGGNATNEAIFGDWVRRNYHQPSDEWSPTYHAEYMAKEVRYYFLLVLSVASDRQRPRWIEGSFFAPQN